MAVFDTANRDLYVACTGDSRAVAGVWEPTEDGNGRWRVEVLSEDQTGRNLDEKKRYACCVPMFHCSSITLPFSGCSQSIPPMKLTTSYETDEFSVDWSLPVHSGTHDTNGHGPYKKCQHLSSVEALS